MFETLLYSVNNNIATISFNRPDHMNSFNNVMGEELESLTNQIRLDPTIKTVLLNGAGSLFMAGGDIHFFHTILDNIPQGVMKIIRTLNASIINLMQMSKLVVASVHGSVAGVGMSFMLACDLIIAADNTKFTMAYSGLGISPDGGASYNLPRLAGSKKAMELMLFSEIFDANTALQHGLLNWVVPSNELESSTIKLLNKLTKGPTQSFASVKKLVNTTWNNNLESQLELEAKAFEKCSASQDFKEGIKSFLQKKKPEFVGK